ncbi:hypothetical protein [Methylobacterium sp. 88A]|uniref:hypothetical protein n=1 Tax=Methylobacterium sp. 88A TaxID=1131813 RepID=UPI0003A9E84A|nr:hypothetical protein [Methylobacterium sp. 88A]
MRKGLFYNIEKILFSSTMELRLLAEIAGEDPATLFIGTVMDDADIRGQDLRGMCFTHLDINKVKSDSNTKWDNIIDKSGNLIPCPHNISYAIKSASAIILLKNLRYQGGPSLLGLRKLKGAVVFNQDEEQAFREVSKSFEGAKIVIIESVRKLDSIGLIKEDFDSKTIILAAYSGGYRFLDKYEYKFAKFLIGPLVLVPMPALSKFGVMPTMSGPMIDLVALIINNWNKFYKQAYEYGVSIFFRAKGVGQDPISDAWCQILNSVTRSGLGGCDGLTIIGSGQEADGKLPHRLFASLETSYFDVPVSLARSFDGGVLIDPRHRTANADESYKAAVRILLEQSGWHLNKPGFSLKNPSSDVRISNGGKEFFIEISGEILDRQAWRTNNDWYQKELDIYRIERVIVSEEISDRQLVGELVNYGRLWVTARDICNFDAKHGSIWSVISQQMRRVGRSINLPIRTIYLAIIIRIAISYSTLNSEDIALLRNIFTDPAFGDKYVLSQRYTKKLGKNSAISRATVDLKRKYIDGRIESVLEIDLDMTYDGPLISRIERMI